MRRVVWPGQKTLKALDTQYAALVQKMAIYQHRIKVLDTVERNAAQLRSARC